MIGGTLTGPLIFILPPLFYTRMRQLEAKHNKQQIEEEMELMLSDTDLLLKHSYGAIEMQRSNEVKEHPKTIIKQLLKLIRSECLIAAVVIIFGAGATITSTYFSFFDIKGLNEFWSPCIQNISLSKLLLPK